MYKFLGQYRTLMTYQWWTSDLKPSTGENGKRLELAIKCHGSFIIIIKPTISCRGLSDQVKSFNCNLKSSSGNDATTMALAFWDHPLSYKPMLFFKLVEWLHAHTYIYGCRSKFKGPIHTRDPHGIHTPWSIPMIHTPLEMDMTHTYDSYPWSVPE